MDPKAEARYLELWREEGRTDLWRNLVVQLHVPTQDDLGLAPGRTAGHEWFRLPSYGGYLVACSCGWRSVETNHLGRMLDQVRDHLTAARQAREAPAWFDDADAAQHGRGFQGGPRSP